MLSRTCIVCIAAAQSLLSLSIVHGLFCFKVVFRRVNLWRKQTKYSMFKVTGGVQQGETRPGLPGGCNCGVVHMLVGPMQNCAPVSSNRPGVPIGQLHAQGPVGTIHTVTDANALRYNKSLCSVARKYQTEVNQCEQGLFLTEVAWLT